MLFRVIGVIDRKGSAPAQQNSVKEGRVGSDVWGLAAGRPGPGPHPGPRRARRPTDPGCHGVRAARRWQDPAAGSPFARAGGGGRHRRTRAGNRGRPRTSRSRPWLRCWCSSGAGPEVTRDPVRLLGHLQQLLKRPTGEPIPLMFVDDLPLLDPLSAVVISQLMESRTVVLLATVRAGEPLPQMYHGRWSADGVLQDRSRAADGRRLPAVARSRARRAGRVQVGRPAALDERRNPAAPAGTGVVGDGGRIPVPGGGGLATGRRRAAQSGAGAGARRADRPAGTGGSSSCCGGSRSASRWSSTTSATMRAMR